MRVQVDAQASAFDSLTHFKIVTNNKNKRAISYSEFLNYYQDERLVLTSGIKDNWDAQRHIDYIIELQTNGNAGKLQFLVAYIGQLEEAVEVIISLQNTSIITFRIKTLEEKRREYLHANWQTVLGEVHDLIENNNHINDPYIEEMLIQLKPYDHDAIETLMSLHEKYKASRRS